MALFLFLVNVHKKISLFHIKSQYLHEVKSLVSFQDK